MLNGRPSQEYTWDCASYVKVIAVPTGPKIDSVVLFVSMVEFVFARITDMTSTCAMQPSNLMSWAKGGNTSRFSNHANVKTPLCTLSIEQPTISVSVLYAISRSIEVPSCNTSLIVMIPNFASTSVPYTKGPVLLVSNWANVAKLVVRRQKRARNSVFIYTIIEIVRIQHFKTARY